MRLFLKFCSSQIKTENKFSNIYKIPKTKLFQHTNKIFPTIKKIFNYIQTTKSPKIKPFKFLKPKKKLRTKFLKHTQNTKNFPKRNYSKLIREFCFDKNLRILKRPNFRKNIPEFKFWTNFSKFSQTKTQVLFRIPETLQNFKNKFPNTNYSKGKTNLNMFPDFELIFTFTKENFH